MNKGYHVPIIALTAHVEDENRKRCLDIGMNSVLAKPLTKEKAEKVLEEFIPQSLNRNNAMVPIKAQLYQDESQIIDFDLAKIQVNGQQSLVDELFALLIESIPEEKMNLDNSHVQNNWEQIKKLAHKLKSSASYCGAIRLKNTCTLLETTIQEGQTECYEPLFKQLLHELDEAGRIIKKYLVKE